MDHAYVREKNGKRYLKVKLTDYALLTNSLLNKGLGFTHQEREDFNLFGLLPPEETTLPVQVLRAYQTLQSKSSDIEKYINLRELQDSNETLFYKLLTQHIEELMPIVYTPVVGAGCQRYSHIYRRPRGVFIAYPDVDRIDRILAHPRFESTKVIVVSDGERILGLGDQGAGGMGIPIGKLSLYTACAGIHPVHTLPILLDVGTNNQSLLEDPLYIGWHNTRIRGKNYDDFIEAFVSKVKKRFPHALLHWEDFAQQNANPILARYRDHLCTFNDDIQGTAAVATGAVLAAINVTGERLTNQRIVIVGSGSAGCGISSLLMQAMIDEGLSESEAKKHIFLVDKEGLLVEGMACIQTFQKPFIQPQDMMSQWERSNNQQINLYDVVHNVQPTILIGVCGQPKIFTQEIVKEMANHVERPIIFPLSNPTAYSEATPQDLINWTEGRVIISTGSPFGKIKKNGQEIRVDQTNNCYIFPGLGLGLIAVQARRVTDKMFMVAAKALANTSPAKQNREANLLPPLSNIRQVSFEVAVAVAEEAINSGLSTFKDRNTLEGRIRNFMWTPEYLPYIRWGLLG